MIDSPALFFGFLKLYDQNWEYKKYQYSYNWIDQSKVEANLIVLNPSWLRVLGFIQNDQFLIILLK